MEKRKTQGVVTVLFSGNLDVQRSPEIVEFLEGVLSEEETRIVLDLHDVRLMSSTAAGLIVKFTQQAQSAGRTCRIGRLSKGAKKTLELLDLLRYFEDLEKD